VRPASALRRVFAVGLGLLSIALGFLLGTPYAIFDLPTFLNWQAYDLRLYAQLGTDFFEGPSWLWHLRFLLFSENGVLLILAVFGAILAVKRLRWLGILLVSFPVLHALSMSLQGTRYDRTWLPMAPFMCLLAAVAVAYAADWLSARQRNLAGRSTWVAAALTLVLIIPLGLGSAAMDILFTEKEVRVRALEWIEQNLPHGSHVAVEMSAPPLSADDWRITRTVSLAQHDLDWYRSQGVDYLAVSATGAWNPNRSVAYEQWYQHILTACQPLAVLEGPGLGLPGRYFWIYELKSCPSQ
jgi:hypothetical protein